MRVKRLWKGLAASVVAGVAVLAMSGCSSLLSMFFVMPTSAAEKVSALRAAKEMLGQITDYRYLCSDSQSGEIRQTGGLYLDGMVYTEVFSLGGEQCFLDVDIATDRMQYYDGETLNECSFKVGQTSVTETSFDSFVYDQRVAGIVEYVMANCLGEEDYADWSGRKLENQSEFLFSRELSVTIGEHEYTDLELDFDFLDGKLAVAQIFFSTEYYYLLVELVAQLPGDAQTQYEKYRSQQLDIYEEYCLTGIDGVLSSTGGNGTTNN